MSRDPLCGLYTQRRYFGADFQKARERLAPLGGVVQAGEHDFEAFTYTLPGKLRLIFYPHRTTAGNHHIRVRVSGKFDPKALRDALFALAENSCTFQCPSHAELHREAVTAALDRDHPSHRVGAAS